jgi:hypothetical protein
MGRDLWWCLCLEDGAKPSRRVARADGIQSLGAGLTHRADLQLAPGIALRTGLGLWNSVPGTIAVELALWIAGTWIYVRTTRARDRVGGLASE